MKKILFTILFIPIILFSQEKVVKIQYNVFYNTDIPTSEIGYLFIHKNQEKSIYLTESIKDSLQVNNKNDDDIIIKLSSEKEDFNYFDYSKNKLLSRDDIFRDSYLIEEDIPLLEWKLLEETKLINDIKVNKAICYFRGRNYIAWYSISNPIKAGPWKFNGLPGLIFEIYDETKRYNWLLKKIEIVDYDFNSLEIDDEKKITIKEYAELKFNDKSISEQLLSKLPRGTKIVSQKSFRTGFEIKFEWEEEKKKQ